MALVVLETDCVYQYERDLQFRWVQRICTFGPAIIKLKTDLFVDPCWLGVC